MTPEDREKLITRHDELVEVYNNTDSPAALDEIGLLEVALFFDPDRPHQCFDLDACLTCMEEPTP